MLDISVGGGRRYFKKENSVMTLHLSYVSGKQDVMLQTIYQLILLSVV